MASKAPQASVIATDISAAALALAGENAATLKLTERVVFRQGDLFGALHAEEKGTFDVAVANPPYVDQSASATLAPEVRDHEPREALYAEDGGLSLVRRILAEAGAWLRPGGWLGMELGQGQADEARRLAESAGCYSGVEIREDHAKLPRYVLARRSP
jgi:release factor glutamine methyltransferase